MADRKTPIDTPGLKDVLEKDVPLAGKLLAEGKYHILVRGAPRTGKSHIRDRISEVSALKILGEINCSSLAPSLIDSILFGIEKGVATNVKGRTGLLADKSKPAKIVILEEIGELPKELQAKLLVYLETGEFLPVGANWEKSDVSTTRIIATSNAEDDKFRPDFLARFWEVKVPPLHARREDIPSFLNLYLSGKEKKLCPEELFCLMAYNWPNGVSEIEKACIRIQQLMIQGISDGQRMLSVRMLTNWSFPIKDLYFNLLYENVVEVESTLNELFPHFISQRKYFYEPIPDFNYDELIKEWHEMCHLFWQDHKYPGNIYEQLAKGIKTLPWSPRSEYLFSGNPYYKNFFSKRKFDEKEGRKFLDKLWMKIYSALYYEEDPKHYVEQHSAIETAIPEDNNIESHQPTFETTTPDEYKNQFWEYQVELGRKAKDMSERFGININSAKYQIKKAKERVTPKKDEN